MRTDFRYLLALALPASAAYSAPVSPSQSTRSPSSDLSHPAPKANVAKARLVTSTTKGADVAATPTAASPELPRMFVPPYTFGEETETQALGQKGSQQDTAIQYVAGKIKVDPATLEVASISTSESLGVTHVYLRQYFKKVAIVNIDSNGSVLSAGVSRLKSALALKSHGTKLIPAVDAVRTVIRVLGFSASGNQISLSADGKSVTGTPFADPIVIISPTPYYLPTRQLDPAWDLQLKATEEATYKIWVSRTSGEILGSNSLTTNYGGVYTSSSTVSPQTTPPLPTPKTIAYRAVPFEKESVAGASVDGRNAEARFYLSTRSTPSRDLAMADRRPTEFCVLGMGRPGILGEGWSDVLAYWASIKSTDTRNTNKVMGKWCLNAANRIRSYPYSTSTTTNPLMYSNVKTNIEVHEGGTIWATMLYEVYWNMVDQEGFESDVSQTTSNAGNIRFLLIMEGMKLQTCSPNFVTARDAIISADKTVNSGAFSCAIWRGFAKRGLGTGALGNVFTNSNTLPSGC
ncbi:Fungalysin/Thermolysin Extracellular metalloproteinase 5 [Phlyctochytrium planicorne]|nr:Fungalysin/Thermolysin Extracellular metalloproteinase 5 [Phlyctochytrium planicorne]